MNGIGISIQRWQIAKGRTGLVTIEKGSSLEQSIEQSIPIREGVSLNDLAMPKLMRPFSHPLLGRLIVINEGEGDPKCD